MNVRPITVYVITPHAASEMARRDVSLETVQKVLAEPGQRLEVRPGRDVLQSQMPEEKTQKSYLVRIFVDVDRWPAEVVTIYRTSKVSKYWRNEP